LRGIGRQIDAVAGASAAIAQAVHHRHHRCALANDVPQVLLSYFTLRFLKNDFGNSGLMTKTIRSRSNREVGELVEGHKILSKTVVIPPDPIEKRLGVYDYLVEAAEVVPPSRKTRAPAPPSSGGTRMTPSERGTVLRRIG
jgi:hypothetical protein